jgi:hypothetical protein
VGEELKRRKERTEPRKRPFHQFRRREVEGGSKLQTWIFFTKKKKGERIKPIFYIILSKLLHGVSLLLMLLAPPLCW